MEELPEKEDDLFYEDDFISIRIIDGIVTSYCKQELIMTKEFAELALNERLRVCGNNTYPLLNDVRMVKYITKDAMHLLNSDKGIAQLTAGAFIIKSKAQEIMGNFFIRFKPHKIPARLFTDITKAEQWLQQYKILH